MEKLSRYATGDERDRWYIVTDVPWRITHRAYGWRVGQGGYGHAVAWAPRSQVVEVENDIWTNCPARAYAIPSWLYLRWNREGKAV